MILAVDTRSQTWAKAPTIKQAKQALRKEGGTAKNANLYTIPDDYYLDEMGIGHGSKLAVRIDK